MSATSPKPYPVVYDPTLGLQYAFQDGFYILLNANPAGLILPSVTTTQRLALTPPEGTMVYDTTAKQVFYWHTAKWDALAAIEVEPPIDLVGQTADIPATTLLIPLVGGMYTFTAHANQAGGAGTTNPTLTITYTDHVGTNTNVPVGSVPVQHPGVPSSYTFTLYSVAGQPISFAVTGGVYGTGSYDLAVALTKSS